MQKLFTSEDVIELNHFYFNFFFAKSIFLWLDGKSENLSTMWNIYFKTNFFLTGRGKRKMDVVEMSPSKKSRIDQDLSAIEKLTTTVITIDESPKEIVKTKETTDANHSLKQSLTHRKSCKAEKQLISEVKMSSFEICKEILLEPKIRANQGEVLTEISEICEIPIPTSLAPIEKVSVDLPDLGEINDQDSERKETVTIIDSEKSNGVESKDLVLITEHQNWLTPSSRKVTDASTRGESISTVQVIDEETRMSAESGSRSQTPARNISAPGMSFLCLAY